MHITIAVTTTVHKTCNAHKSLSLLNSEQAILIAVHANRSYSVLMTTLLDQNRAYFSYLSLLALTCLHTQCFSHSTLQYVVCRSSAVSPSYWLLCCLNQPSTHSAHGTLRSCGASAVKLLLATVRLCQLWHLILDTILRSLHWIKFRSHAVTTPSILPYSMTQHKNSEIHSETSPSHKPAEPVPLFAVATQGQLSSLYC